MIVALCSFSAVPAIVTTTGLELAQTVGTHRCVCVRACVCFCESKDFWCLHFSCLLAFCFFFTSWLLMQTKQTIKHLFFYLPLASCTTIFATDLFFVRGNTSTCRSTGTCSVQTIILTESISFNDHSHHQALGSQRWTWLWLQWLCLLRCAALGCW